MTKTVTVTFVLNADAADKFGMKVVEVKKPEGFEIVGKFGWMLANHGHFPLKKLHEGAKKAEAPALPAGFTPEMLAAFQAFMATQAAPAATPAAKKPARTKKGA